MKPHLRPAFTLIELLVVISIIALLIGILLPALGAARFTARVLACSTQEQQLGRAMAAYQTDSDGYYPITFQHTNAPFNRFNNLNELTWDDALGMNGYDGRSLSKDDADGVLSGDQSFSLYQCPLDDWGRNYFGMTDVAPRSYTMNPMDLDLNSGVTGGNLRLLRGVSGKGPDGGPASRRVDDVTNGSGAIVMSEAIMLAVLADPIISQNVLGSNLAGIPGVWPQNFDTRINLRPISTVLGHHARGAGGAESNTVLSSIPANFMFADGHVALTESQDTFREGGGGGDFVGVWDMRGTSWDSAPGRDSN